MKKNSNMLKGKNYWRSLNQLAATPEFKKFLEREFPEGASELPDGMSRRKFLSLMGASVALAGLVGCRRPVEKIIPYVKSPEEIIPGIPKQYATTMPLGLNSYGLLVETHEGRPTKIEGNIKHPSSLGGTTPWIQAAILGLYDPDRSQVAINEGTEKDWQEFVNFWQTRYPGFLENNGTGLAILSTSSASPTMYRLQQNFRQKFPEAKRYVYEAVSDENIRTGIEAATGTVYIPKYDFGKAKVILSLDADFIANEAENILSARGFIDGRRVSSEKDDMNRLYVIESTYTLTGGMADHRKRLPSSHMLGFVVALGQKLTEAGLNIPVDQIDLPDHFIFDQKWLAIVASDLLNNRGKSLLVAGRQQPAQVHALVLAINQALGNVGTTVSYRKPDSEILDSVQNIKKLARDIEAGAIDTLLILDANPVYNGPADLNFKEMLARVKNTVHFSLYYDETSQQTKWHVPLNHFLESWGDAQALDGTLSVVQPMIQPLFDGHSEIEIVHLLTEATEVSGYELVRQTWEPVLGKVNFEKRWRRVLHDGILENSAQEFFAPTLNRSRLQKYLSENPVLIRSLKSDNLEIVFRPSPVLHDGRFANNGWLQELPDGTSKLCWDNAALISHETAKQLGLKNEDLILINLNGREIPMPVWILPGQADFSLNLTLGYGRTAGGRIAENTGFDAYRLRTTTDQYIATGASVQKTIDTYLLVNTQDHNSMEGRPLVREATLAEYKNRPAFAPDMVEHPPLRSLWEEHSYEEGYQWGMVIDLNACTGCNTCTIACQSENNIPIVGKEQVREGREMHWLRLDRYFAGDISDPEMVTQPVACQHCENAPCEQVCPVAATVHDSEGLNVMTYNRCIGTRYCSNNCPYKVRRFNFFNYTNQLPEIVHMAQNPDVTVRSRGVMEKCTYCLQRISAAKIDAKKHKREIKDGDVVSACQQACPTNAITFGNINDARSRVTRLKRNNRNYEMLAELNIKPRTSYLAKLRNPHPDLEQS